MRKQLPQAQKDPDIRDQVRKLRNVRCESLASLSFILLDESTWPWATLRTLTRTTTVPSSPQVLQKKALSKGFASIYKRFLTDETYCESQSKVQWTEELCLNLDQLAQEDRSYVATRPERERYDNMWVFRQLPSEDDHEIRSETFSPFN